MRSTLLGGEKCRHRNLKLQQADLDDNLADRHSKTRSDALRGPFGTIPHRFWKMSKNVKNRHFEFQKTDSGEGPRWSPGAETKTGDSSRYFLKDFLPDFLDVLENLLEINYKGRCWKVAW